jgi:hypothetical protein
MALPAILTDEENKTDLSVEDSRQVLNFRIQKQMMSNWCWAAVSSSIRSFYQPSGPMTQGEIASEILGLPYCSMVPPLPPCDQKADLSAVLSRYNFLSEQMDVAAELGVISGEISHNRPVCCQVYYEELGGHFVVIYGCGTVDPADAGSTAIYLADPMDGGSRLLTYHQLVAGYRGGLWSKTYLTKAS